MITLTKPLSSIIESYSEHQERLGREVRVSTHRLGKLNEKFGGETYLVPSEFEEFIWGMGKLTPSSRNRYRALIKALLNWAKDRELASGDISMRVMKMEREDNQRTRRLSEDEQKRLEEVMDEDLADLFHAALDTGLRKGALFQLRFRDIQDGMLVVPASIQKHRQSQRIPLTQRLRTIVERRVVGKEEHQFIFNTLNWEKKWNRVRKLAKVKDLRWHDLRGEFASRLVEKDVRVEVVSKLLGHRSLTTTQRYLRTRVSDFEDAIGRLDGN